MILIYIVAFIMLCLFAYALSSLDRNVKEKRQKAQKEVDDLLCKKCKKIWIAYGMSTIILLAGLIASFLI